MLDMMTDLPTPTDLTQHRVEFVNLEKFFNPKSIAFIGATEDLSKFGGRCMRQMIDFGFAGQIYPINPKRDKVFGLTCYPSLGHLPTRPDHVGIVLPAALVPQAIRECGQLQIPFATVFSAGFAETAQPQDVQAQVDLLALARECGVRIMGPNCNGMINFVDAFALTSTATINGPKKKAGDIGIVGQSGGASQVNVMWRAQQLGLGVSYQVSCGNSVDLDMLDFAAFMLDSKDTKVVLILAEHIANGHKLKALAQKALAKGKPMVMVKAGKTAAGSKAAASHTGALTGEDAVFDAALKQLGIIRVDDYSELYMVASILRRGRLPKSKRSAAISISGGNLVMLADLGSAHGIEWPAYSHETHHQLSELLPGFSSAENPTDLTAAAIGQAGKFAMAAELILNDENVDTMIPVLTIANSAEINALAELSSNSTKPLVMLWTGCASDDPELTPSSLIAQGHAVFQDALPCVKMIQKVQEYADFVDRSKGHQHTRPSGLDRDAVQGILNASGPVISEHVAKQLLSHYGIPVSQEHLAKTASEAIQFAKQLGGPVALKISSPDILHKTESGAIRLNVLGDSGVQIAFDGVVQDARRYKPDAAIEGVLVQEMAPKGVEMLMGMSSDPSLGGIVSLGLGGIFVETLKDITHRLPPLSEEEALSAIQSLKGIDILKGTRGQGPSDLHALASAYSRLSWLVYDFQEQIQEIDVNPIIVFPGAAGVKVIDALILKKK